MKYSKYLIAISILFSFYFADEDIVVEQENRNHENVINDIQLTQEPENRNIPIENTEDTSKQAIPQKEAPVTQPSVAQNLPAGEDGNMIRLINETRVANGLGQLTYDPTIYSVADIRLNEISTYFSHTRPDGSEFFTVSSSVDGENISKYGAGDAASSFNGFMNSQSHRENILYSGFTRVACKKAVIDGTVYWIQLFGY